MNTETALQQAITMQLGVYEREGKLIWFPVPNSLYVAATFATEKSDKELGEDDRKQLRKTRENRARRKLAWLRDVGMIRHGVPDLILCFPGGQFAAMELKAEKRGMSEGQGDFAKLINVTGGWFAVVRSFEEAKVRVDTWIRLARMKAERVA